MKIRSRLKHAAGPVLSKFLNRNNDLNGFWAPGLLYSDLPTAPHCVTFDLLRACAHPAGDAATRLAARYATWLGAALQNVDIRREALERAELMVEFNSDARLPPGAQVNAGEPCSCTIEMVTKSGHTARLSANAQCASWRAGKFTRRAGALLLA